MEIKKAIIKIMEQFLCLVGCHAWASKALSGEKPTPDQLAGGALGFWDFARIYCKRCGIECSAKIYRKYTKRLKNERNRSISIHTPSNSK